MELGGNGDYYISLVEYDKNEKFLKAISIRISTSGGHAPSDVKVAVTNLLRVTEDSAILPVVYGNSLETIEQKKWDKIEREATDRFLGANGHLKRHVNMNEILRWLKTKVKPI